MRQAVIASELMSWKDWDCAWPGSDPPDAGTGAGAGGPGPLGDGACAAVVVGTSTKGAPPTIIIYTYITK